MRGTPLRRGILALDIEGFGQPDRTDPQRTQLRTHLHALLDHALATAEIPRAQIAARSDLGDGILVLFDPAVPAATLLHPLLTDLTTRLATHNQTATGPDRLRLRIAVHEGHVLADTHGHTGHDLNHTFRLLDAQAARTVLANSPSANAVLVVSDSVYQGVVRHGYGGIDPAVWQPVRVHAKETRSRAWINLPGLTTQPHLPEVLRATQTEPARLPIPRELPRPAADFTGRTSELTRLRELLGLGNTPADGLTTEPGRPVVISATGGMGKSALAVHAAYQLADRFPDGQLFADLYGWTPGMEAKPRRPIDVLTGFLERLGMNRWQVPSDLNEAAACYRTMLADRRVLIVLDNARDANQVRSLLPGDSSCAVLITSRDRLAGLEAVARLPIDLLPDREAIDLLARLVEDKRVEAEPGAAAQLARACGYLPLALRIAGALLNRRPRSPIAVLVERLADERSRLDRLQLDDLAVRVAFQVSYEVLGRVDPQAARAFRLVALLNGADLGVPVVSALLDQPAERAETLLDRLVDAHLLEVLDQDRYTFHDLLRSFARDQADRDEPPSERDAALNRALRFYEAAVGRADQFLRAGAPPAAVTGDGSPIRHRGTAVVWLKEERLNLIAAVKQAATADTVPPDLVSALGNKLARCLQTLCYWEDATQAAKAALAAADRNGDRPSQARALNSLGSVDRLLDRYTDAVDCHQRACALYRGLGDRHGEADSLNELAQVEFMLDRHGEAMAHLRLALAVYRSLGDLRGEAHALNELGKTHLVQGRHAAAADHHRQALAIYQDLADRHGQAEALHELGETLRAQGHYAAAADHHRQALAIYQDLADRFGEARALCELGRALGLQSRCDEAIKCLKRAGDRFLELGDRVGQASVLCASGHIHLMQHRLDHATTDLQRALDIFREAGYRHAQARALDYLGEVRREQERHADAIRCHEESLALRQAIGDRYGHAEALAHLGLARAAAGETAR